MKRYNLTYMGMELHKEGQFVTYEGHQTKIQQLEKKIKQLEKELEDYEGCDDCIFEVDFDDERN